MLGDDTYGKLAVPAGQFTQIAAGSLHTCGVRADQTVVCWGLGQGGASNVPAEAFLSVASGNPYTCGVRVDRTLVCWDSDYHYFGETSTVAHADLERDPNAQYFEDVETAERRHLELLRLHRPYLLAPSGEFLSVAGGTFHTCGVRVDRTVVCWGMNEAGQASPPGGTTGSGF